MNRSIRPPSFAPLLFALTALTAVAASPGLARAADREKILVGATLPLQWDIRLAAESARIGFVFVRRGVVPEALSTWTLARLVGMARACDLLFSGRMIDAPEALAMGLVNRVVPHEDLIAAARDTATELATLSSPRSIAVMKRLLYTHQFTDLATATAEGDEEMVASFPSEDFREGVASFLAKRPPRFTGR